MIITAISAENAKDFEGLLCGELVDYLDEEGCFALGAIYQEDGHSLAAGVLMFSVEEGKSGDEIMTAAMIRWLYVARQLREKGVADALFAQLMQILGASGVGNLVCDVPMPSEYDELCAYLESLGFEFSLADVFELRTTLGELSESPALKGKRPAERAIALKDVPDASFRQLLRRIKRLPDISDRLSDRRDYYEQCISMVAKNAVGAALLKYRPAQGLELLYLGALEKPAKLMGELMLCALEAARKRYPGDTRLIIKCRSENAAGVMSRLLPQAQPLMVRRGYLDAARFWEEAEL